MGIKILIWLALTTSLLMGHAQRVQKKISTTNKCQSISPETCQEIQMLKEAFVNLSKQVMMQQLAAEERARMNGYSGVQLIRGTKRGPRNYDYTSHLAPSAFSIYDLANYDRSIGYGEVSVMMNGINFRTRQNDFKLVQASTTSKKYHAWENIPFPAVPPQVRRKATVKEQIIEMREWFRAFQKQDKSVRDYTKYFKPVMCYMEGAWTLDKDLVEPFPSDRHQIDATSWEKLHETFRFTAFTGAKHRMENISFLPTCIIKHNNNTGLPEYAQWNYRILCHPIDQDIPLSYFQQEDDLTHLVATGQTKEEIFHSRAARFKLVDPHRKTSNYQLMDEIFAKIPGKDNHGANLTFTVFAEPMYETAFIDKHVELNAGYYHRTYKSFKNGAGGISYTALGFNDENLWMAMTTQARVASFKNDEFYLITKKNGELATRFREGEMRLSYAIPLEIVYMTPLLSWNPYNLAFNKDNTTSVKGNRSGGPKKNQAFNGMDKTHFYMTPSEFFKGHLDKSDPADKVRTDVYVLDRKRTPRKVSASGTKIFLQDIDGIGKVRLRYPITPLSGEGSSVWKELSALKDHVLFGGHNPLTTVQFEMSLSIQDPPGEHTHGFSITNEDYRRLLDGEEINLSTEEAQEHTHDLTIVYKRKEKKFMYTRCDGGRHCTDGHGPAVFMETRNSNIP